MKTMRSMGIGLLVAMLAGCAAAPAPLPEPVAEVATQGLSERVARVRMEAGEGEGLDVQPWRDPTVEDLRESAASAERRGDPAAASAYVEQALAILPDDPALLQHSAELALLRGDVNTAIEQAGRSFQLGPQVGSLCRRNWGTMREAYEVAGHREGVEVANRKLEECTVAGPVRM